MSMQANSLVTVAPPYDGVFIMLRRHLAPTAVFAYDRYWIMTEKQVAAILGRMREFAAAAEDELRKAGADRDEGDRNRRRELRETEKSLDSMLAVISWLERPEPWQGPDDEKDASLDLDGEDEGETEAD